MGWTLKIVDGQLDLDVNTGLLNTVEGERKCAQDIAECMLQEYDPVQNYGSYLTAVVANSTAIPFAGDLFIRHYISQAVDTLKSKQLEDPASTPDERINEISQLLTVTDQDTQTMGFYLKVETESGSAETSITNLSASQATSLNQLYEDIS